MTRNRFDVIVGVVLVMGIPSMPVWGEAPAGSASAARREEAKKEDTGPLRFSALVFGDVYSLAAGHTEKFDGSARARWPQTLTSHATCPGA